MLKFNKLSEIWTKTIWNTFKVQFMRKPASPKVRLRHSTTTTDRLRFFFYFFYLHLWLGTPLKRSANYTLWLASAATWHRQSQRKPYALSTLTPLLRYRAIPRVMWDQSAVDQSESSSWTRPAHVSLQCTVGRAFLRRGRWRIQYLVTIL